MKVNTVTQALITKTIPFPGMKVALLKREQKWYQLCRKKLSLNVQFYSNVFTQV